MIDIQYNGMLGSLLKVYAKEYVSIPSASRRFKEVTIPGRDGVLHIDEQSFEETEISMQMNYIGREEQWGERWRAIQKWLSATNSELTLSDDADFFFKISRVKLSDNEKKSRRIGEFKATFITKDGLQYLRSGKMEYGIAEVLFNPYCVCHPVYVITGEGKCTLEVNGKQMKANVSEKLVIDTDLMLAYRSDGNMANTSVLGKYKDLYLLEGENDINISSGFGLKVIPNWRCL